MTFNGVIGESYRTGICNILIQLKKSCPMTALLFPFCIGLYYFTLTFTVLVNDLAKWLPSPAAEILTLIL